MEPPDSEYEDSLDQWLSEYENFFLSDEMRDSMLSIMRQPSLSIGQQYVCVIDAGVWLDSLDYWTTRVTWLKAELLLPLVCQAHVEAQRDILDQTMREEAATGGHSSLTVKEAVRVCWENVPSMLQRTKVPSSVDAGTYIEFQGTVIRAGMLKALEYEKDFECATCHNRLTLTAQVEDNFQFRKPRVCRGTIGEKPCKFASYQPVKENGSCRDIQEARVQEQVRNLDFGKMPRALTVVLQSDLVDAFKPGDDVLISGVLHRRWRTMRAGSRPVIELVLVALSVSVQNEAKLVESVSEELRDKFTAHWHSYRDAPLAGRNVILRSICPDLYGLNLVKLALSLVLAGGVAQVTESGTDSRVRGESHLLLIGDPGCGKSQIMRFAAAVASRSVVTTGTGTSGAGLTVTAVKDSTGDWMLEAGALVLADGGLCAIDEFSHIKERDRATIHEAMEQQTISVAKAGLVTKLQTRCSIVAASNAKGRYDPSKSVQVNAGLDSPLLSRFDLVLVLRDEHLAEWDTRVANFLLAKAAPGLIARDNDVIHVDDDAEDESLPQMWSLEKLQAYFQYVRLHFSPTMSRAAQTILSTYYQVQRASIDRVLASTTIRMLESLARLAQAHAKLMMRERVEIEDAVNVVVLMESSMHTASMIPGSPSAVHSLISETPDADYILQERAVLRVLGLQHLLERKQPKDDQRPAGRFNDYDEAAAVAADDDDGNVNDEYMEEGELQEQEKWTGGGSGGEQHFGVQSELPTTTAASRKDELMNEIFSQQEKKRGRGDDDALEDAQSAAQAASRRAVSAAHSLTQSQRGAPAAVLSVQDAKRVRIDESENESQLVGVAAAAAVDEIEASFSEPTVASAARHRHHRSPSSAVVLARALAAAATTTTSAPPNPNINTTLPPPETADSADQTAAPPPPPFKAADADIDDDFEDFF